MLAQYFTFSLDEKVSASNTIEEQSEHADFDHFCNQSDLLALSVSFELQTFVLEIKI